MTNEQTLDGENFLFLTHSLPLLGERPRSLLRTAGEGK